MSKRELEMSGAPLSNCGKPAQPQPLLTGASSRRQTFEVPTEEVPWARASGGANGPALRARPAPTQHIDAQQLWDPLHRRDGSAKRQKKGEVETAEKVVARAGGGAEKIAGGEALVGATVKVYWGGDRKWFKGVVESYDAPTRCHLIHYDDGDRKWHELDQTGEVHLLEKWSLLEPCATSERAAASSGVPPPHLSELPPHLSQLPPHLSELPPHLSELPPHLSQLPPHLSQLPRLAKGKAAAAPKQPLVGPPKPTEEHGDRPEGTISPNTVMDGLDWPKVGVEGEAVEVRVGEVEDPEEEQEEQVEEKEVEEVGEGEGEEGERAVLDHHWQKNWQKVRGLLGARVGVEEAFGASFESWYQELGLVEGDMSTEPLIEGGGRTSSTAVTFLPDPSGELSFETLARRFDELSVGASNQEEEVGHDSEEEEFSNELDDFVNQLGQQASSEQEERDGKCHSVWRTS